MKLEGVSVIVTGGAQGLGRAFTEGLLKRGAKVCFADINVERGQKVEQELHENNNNKDSSFFVPCDISKESDFKELFEKASAKFGNVDIIVNNAGILNELAIAKTVEVNLLGTIRGTTLAIEHMRKDKGGKGGLIVNISSIAGVMPAFFMPTYSATKHAIVGYTKSWATNPCRESVYGINFSCMCPAFSDTAMVNGTINAEDPPLIDFVPNRAAVSALINSMGINTTASVTDALLELIEKDANNGCVVTVDTINGAKYL